MGIELVTVIHQWFNTCRNIPRRETLGDTGKVKAIISLNVILSGLFGFSSALGRATGSANHRLKDCAQFCTLLDLNFFVSDSSRLSFLPLSMIEK